MKIVTTYDDGKPDYERDNFTLVATDNDGNQKSFNIGSGESEDMYLFRDLSDALTVPELMRMAYEAGRRGETWEHVEEAEE